MKVNKRIQLCIPCASKLHGEYLGGRVRHDECENCHECRCIASYGVKISEQEHTERVRITLDVDPRTAVNLSRQAGLWNLTTGEAVDSIMKNYYNKKKGSSRND